jgi:hypothetical protein
LEYFEKLGIDFGLTSEFGETIIISQNNEIYKPIGWSLMDIKKYTDKEYGLLFGIIWEITFNIKSYKSLTHDRNKTYIAKLPKKEIRESKASYWQNILIYGKCWYMVKGGTRIFGKDEMKKMTNITEELKIAIKNDIIKNVSSFIDKDEMLRFMMIEYSTPTDKLPKI